MSEERIIRNAHRDPVSGAVIINDEEAYEQARKRKALASEKEELTRTVSQLRGELSAVQEAMLSMQDDLKQLKGAT